MTDVTTELPQAESADPDGVQVALRAAHTLWSNGETAESLRWLRRAAETASDEGADIRSLQLAKAAAELRAKLSRKGLVPDSVGPSALNASTPSSLPPAPGFASQDAPLSERVVTATQYPSQRPPRSLMGISSATLERVMQRDSSAPPSAARGAVEEAKLPPEPPPLPLPDVFPPSGNNGLLDGGWGAGKEELAGAALDPRTWSSEFSEQEAPVRPSSSARPPPMPRGSFGPPPLPELEEEEVDSDPEFLTDKPLEAGSYESRQVSVAPHLADEFAPDDWRLSPPEPSAGGAFDFGADAEPLGAYPTSGASPSSMERPVAGDLGFSSAVQSALDTRQSSVDADRSGPPLQPLSARVHHQAVRVALALDPRQPGQFILRALRERELPQNGERVALLVALEPGTPLV
jgi:hypothetical protein